eukprot:scaffold1318_cov362-Pavlova_lutheri.AAC.23
MDRWIPKAARPTTKPRRDRSKATQKQPVKGQAHTCNRKRGDRDGRIDNTHHPAASNRHLAAPARSQETSKHTERHANGGREIRIRAGGTCQATRIPRKR